MSANIRFKCTGCTRSFSVDPSKAGKKLRCPDCNAALTVPQLEGVEAGVTKATKKSAEATSEKPEDGVAKPSKPRRSSDEAQTTADPPKRKKRAESVDPNDIWSQPLSSYSSPAIPETEYEQFGLEPKRKRVQEVTSASSEMTLKVPLVIFGIGMLIGVVSIGMAFGVPAAGRIVSFPAIGLGAILSLWGHWTIRANAFNESTMCGFLYVWFFPYSIYYIFSRFAENKIPFLASFLGNIILVVGLIGMVLADIRLEKAAGGEPAAMMQPSAELVVMFA